MGSKSFLLIINTLAKRAKNSSQIIRNCRENAVTSGYESELLKKSKKMGKNANILIINHLKNSLLSINTLAKSTKKNYLKIWKYGYLFVSLLYKG